MYEPTASDVTPTRVAGEAPVDPPGAAAPDGSQHDTPGEASSDPDAVLEIDVEAIELPDAAPAGPRAFLQTASLHNAVQIESLSRATCVFDVLSRGRSGQLHMAEGELIHAELGTLVGEPAAIEILSWNEGELVTSTRPLVQAATIHTPLTTLLLQLAEGRDEAVDSVRHPPRVRARPAEDDKPTEPHLPAPRVEADVSPPSLPPPRSKSLPPPLPPRVEREAGSVAEVVLSPSGELVQSRGSAPDELAARVAYAARLAELIGRAIRSGAPRGLELRGKGTSTQVKWQADGGVSASLELIQSPKMR